MARGLGNEPMTSRKHAVPLASKATSLWCHIGSSGRDAESPLSDVRGLVYLPGPEILSEAAIESWLSGCVNAEKSRMILTGDNARGAILICTLAALGAGFNVYVCEDQVSRHDAHGHERLLARLSQQGALIVTSEQILYELNFGEEA